MPILAPFTTRPILDQLTGEHGLWVYDPTDGLMKRASVSTVRAAPARLVSVALSADQNNWGPTGLSAADVLLISCSANVLLTGLAAQPDGTQLVIQNSSSSAGVFSLSTQDSRSTAANRFRLGAIPYLTLLPGERQTLIYSAAESGWILGAPPFWVENKARQVLQSYFDDDAWTGLQTSVANGGAVSRSTPWGDTSSALLSTGGSSASGRAGIASKSLTLTGGNNGVRGCIGGIFCATSSNSSQQFTGRIGILNSISAEPTRGAYFRWVDNVNGGLVQAVFAHSGGLATGDTGFSPANGGGGDYFHFAVLLNVAGGYADFYIGSARSLSWACRVSGTAFTDAVGFGSSLLKAVGTTARTMDVFPLRHVLEVA